MDSIEAIHYFEKLNRLRTERVADLVSTQQYNVVSLLSFLFHTNIQGLPGYIDKNTVAGITDFQANKDCLQLVQKLFPNIKYKHRPLRHYPIIGLYLVNHHGLLHIPAQTQFSLYLVCSSRLKDPQREGLREKLTAIKEWAASQNVSLTTQLLVEDELVSAQGETTLSSEQLDQLYLNGLVLAGALPYWWLVSPDENYTDKITELSSQRLQTSYQFIDFGQPQQVNAAYWFEQASHLLADYLECGFQGIAALAFIEQQLNSFPNINWLSNEAKKRSYQKEYEPLYLDVNVLQFEASIAASREETAHKLIQHSFYLQAKETLSNRLPNPPYPWRRKFIAELSQNWQWKPHDFQLLDQRHQANYQYCLEEYQLTQPRLEHYHNVIKQFAKQHGLALLEVNKRIERRLKQLNDLPENGVPILPTALLTRRAEEQLHLYRFAHNGQWKISHIPLSEDKQTGLYQHPSLLNVIAWAIANHVLTKTTRIMLADKTHTVTITQITSLIQQVDKTDIAQTPLTHSNEAASLKQILLLVNFDHIQAKKQTSQNVQLTSLHNDPFNYANRGETLIATVDALIESSEGGWQTLRVEGPLCILELFRRLMPWWQNSTQSSPVACWCPSETYGPLISQRVKRLYLEVSDHYHQNESGEFIIKIADDTYQLLWEPGINDLVRLKMDDGILTYLAKPRIGRYKTKLDIALDSSGVLNQVLRFQSDKHINLVFVVNKQSASIYVLDNQCSLFCQHNIKLTEVTLITHYYRFLSSIKPSATSVRCIHLNQNSHGLWSDRTIVLDESKSKQNYLPVTAELANHSEDADCTIICGPKQFSGKANDVQLFNQVSEFLLGLRTNASQYPLYITGIRYLDHSATSVNEFIRQKQQLEKRLNRD